MAQLFMSQTGRPQTGGSSTLSQPSETPSAPPWMSQSPHQAASHRPGLPHAKLSQQGSSPQLASSASARLESSAARTGAATYPAVYASSPSSGQPSAEAIAETGGAHTRRAARPGPSAGPHQPRQEVVGRSASDSLQAEAVQAETPRMGYAPAAVSFMMGRLQVRHLLSFRPCVIAARVIAQAGAWS